MVTREGGAQPKEYLAKYAADRVRTVATAWLGSTHGLRRVPRPQVRPVHARRLLLAGRVLRRREAVGRLSGLQLHAEPRPEGLEQRPPVPAGDRSGKRRTSSSGRKRLANGSRNSWRSWMRSKRRQFSAWRERTLVFVKDAPTGWTALVPASATQSAAIKPVTERRESEARCGRGKAGRARGGGAAPPEFTIEGDGRIVFTAKAATKTTMESALQAGWLAALRVEALPDAAHGRNILRGDARSGTFKPAFTYQKAGAKAVSLAIRQADADRKSPRYFNGVERLGITDGWPLPNAQRAAKAVWLLDQPVMCAEGDKLSVVLDGNVAASLRVSLSALAAPTPTADWTALAKAVQSDGAAARAIWLASTAADPARYTQFKALADRVAECRNGRALTLVTKSAPEPQTIRVLPRGNWQDESGEVVQPAPPHFLPPAANPDAPAAHAARSRELARRAGEPADGARVREPAVEAILRQRLSASGRRPRRAGRMAVAPRAARLARRRVPRERLGREAHGPAHGHVGDLSAGSRTCGPNCARPIRTTACSRRRTRAGSRPSSCATTRWPSPACSISNIGGPSAHAVSAARTTTRTSSSPTAITSPSNDERQYRRGVYTHWQRTFLHPMLANFDAPSREEMRRTRTVANTPQQALTLLNDPTFVEAARVFAAKLLAAPATIDAERLDARFRASARARRQSERERASLTRSSRRSANIYRAHPDDAKKLLRVGLAPRARRR